MVRLKSFIYWRLTTTIHTHVEAQRGFLETRSPAKRGNLFEITHQLFTFSNEQQLFTGIHTQILTYPPKCEQYSTRLKQVCLLAVACKNSISVLLFVESDLWSLLTHLYCRKKDHPRYSMSLISNFLVFGFCSCTFFLVLYHLCHSKARRGAPLMLGHSREEATMVRFPAFKNVFSYLVSTSHLDSSFKAHFHL